MFIFNPKILFSCVHFFWVRKESSLSASTLNVIEKSMTFPTMCPFLKRSACQLQNYGSTNQSSLCRSSSACWFFWSWCLQSSVSWGSSCLSSSTQKTQRSGLLSCMPRSWSEDRNGQQRMPKEPWNRLPHRLVFFCSYFLMNRNTVACISERIC